MAQLVSAQAVAISKDREASRFMADHNPGNGGLRPCLPDFAHSAPRDFSMRRQRSPRQTR
jgi:hypothetical protein